MSSKGQRRLAWAGAVGGALVAGVAAGRVAEHKAVRAARLRPDLAAREPFGALPADRVHTVAADDGLRLHVEEVGPLDAPVTIVFVHGFCLSMGCWHYQRTGLTDLGRLVFFDQRSHGRSDISTASHSTLPQLGRDLEAVLEAVAPTGPVVLVGHSMGGMSIFALAEEKPEFFGSRIAAVALVSTSAGELAEITFGLPQKVGDAVNRIRPKLWLSMGKRAALIEKSRIPGTDFAYAITRRLAFGPAGVVTPSLVEYVDQMIMSTKVQVMADFAQTFFDHDRLHAVPSLSHLPVLVLVGDDDLMTPVEHSRAIAAALPDSELVVLPGAGHMVMMERGSLVNLHLRALVRRALRTAHGESRGTVGA